MRPVTRARCALPVVAVQRAESWDRRRGLLSLREVAAADARVRGTALPAAVAVPDPAPRDTRLVDSDDVHRGGPPQAQSVTVSVTWP